MKYLELNVSLIKKSSTLNAQYIVMNM